MLVLLALSGIFAALLVCYRKNHKRAMALLYPACLGLCGAILWTDLWPHWPGLTLLLGLSLIALPFACFALAVVDMRWGVFATQTFYALAVPVLSCPLLACTCLVLRTWRLVP